MKLLVLCGIPGSGKTTFSRDFLKGKTDWVRVSRDDLRSMRGDYWIPKQEEFITEMENSMVDYALSWQLNVIVDATNLHPKVIAKWKAAAAVWGAEFEIKKFDIALEEAIKRNALRPNPVGDVVITSFYNKYIRHEL